MVVFLALNGLAGAYRTEGKYNEARKTYEESLDLKRRRDDGSPVGMSTSTYMESCSSCCFPNYCTC